MEKLKLPNTLRKPSLLRNIDGSINQGTYNRRNIPVHVQIAPSIAQDLNLITADINNEHVILGEDWLTKTNPTINWKEGTVNIDSDKVNFIRGLLEEEIFITYY